MSDNLPTQKLPDYPHFYPQPSWAHEYGVSHEQILTMRSANLQEQKK